MLRKLTKALWILGVMLVVVVASLAAVAALMETSPTKLVGLLVDPKGTWTSNARSSGKSTVYAAREEMPLFSDSWLEDVGMLVATDFETPLTDPTSLAQVSAARRGRAARGIAELEGQLARMGKPKSDDEAVMAARFHVLIGGLQMFDGRFEDAKKSYVAARAIHPTVPASFGQNIEAMLGVASLRRGETDNCIACCTDASCIFPLAPAAIHNQKTGSSDAIRHFTAYLAKRPDDLGVKWLLNIAHMTLGTYPDKVPSEYLIPLEPFSSKIDVGRFHNIAAKVGLDALGDNDAGACIVDDFNGDGKLDVFTSNVDPEKGPGLFINRGDGTFQERSESAGLTNQIGAANATQADYDNDGDLDILLLRGGWEWAKRPSLMRNRGDGTFEDVTAAAGLIAPIACHSGAWADYDNDGFVDLYMVGEYTPKRPDPRHPGQPIPDPNNHGRLFHNNGNGTFTDHAEKAGVRNDRWGKGAAWGDYDNDGDPDLYVSNNCEPNRLYRNNGDGTFTDVAVSLGVTEPLASFSCWWWDYDNDGRLDLFVAGFANNSLSDIVRSHLGRSAKGERPRLFHNEGPAGFRDVTNEAGLDRVLVVMGSNFGDIDNDGFLDIYLATGRPEYRFVVPNVLFKSVEGRHFEDVTTSSGTGHLQKGHGVAFADWDNDGDVDLFLESGGATPGDRAHNALFENPGHGHHWLTVRLIGTRTNRAAIGARVRVDGSLPTGKTASFHREITSGSSYGGNPFQVTIGVGDAKAIPTLQIDWPTSHTSQTFHNIPLDSSVEITESVDKFRVIERAPRP